MEVKEKKEAARDYFTPMLVAFGVNTFSIIGAGILSGDWGATIMNVDRVVGWEVKIGLAAMAVCAVFRRPHWLFGILVGIVLIPVSLGIAMVAPAILSSLLGRK